MCKIVHMTWSTKNETHEVERCKSAQDDGFDWCGTWHAPSGPAGCRACLDTKFHEAVVMERRKAREVGTLVDAKVPWRRSYLAFIGL